MACPLCGVRKGRRSCPALQQTICAVCCATKRVTEIACPPDCVHLIQAREHPAAVVRRRQERDVAILLPALEGLTERQHQLFFLFVSTIVRHQPEGLARLVDDDVVEASAAVAATLETAARGVIYEHVAVSRPAQRLAAELKALLADIRTQGAAVSDREAAAVLRAIERGAKETRTRADGGEVAYLSLVARLLPPTATEGAPARSGSSLILP